MVNRQRIGCQADKINFQYIGQVHFPTKLETIKTFTLHAKHALADVDEGLTGHTNAGIHLASQINHLSALPSRAGTTKHVLKSKDTMCETNKK